MNNYVCFRYYLLALLVIGGCSTQEFQESDSLAAFSTHLDRKIPRLLDRYDVPGMTLALIRDGDIAWSAAYGYADMERSQKMTVGAICRTESISKSVTAWGVMKLAEEGLIDLDAPISKYLESWKLPESNYSEKEVTVRRLLSNTGGLPLGRLGEEYPPESQIPSLKKYLAREAKLAHPPGAGFEYSNVGFNLLELLIEEVTGDDFEDYMTAEILRPLHMDHSSFAWHTKWSAAVATGYDLQGNPVPPYVYPGKASGGLLATVEDIARFVSAGMESSLSHGNRILNTESISTIYTPQIPITGLFGLVADSYGFGHFIETLPSGRKALWHGGQGHGWMTHFHTIPETGDGIVILTNSQRSWPLIANVLNDWSEWIGITGIKFGRIATATSVLWGVIASIFLYAILKAGLIIAGILKNKRMFTFSLRIQPAKRITQLFLGVVIIAALLWAFNQPYLFISSIFPAGTPWLAWGLLMLSGLLFLNVLFPSPAKTRTKKQQIGI